MLQKLGVVIVKCLKHSADSRKRAVWMMRPRSGKPKLSALQDRMLVRLSVRNRRLTSTQLKREWEEITIVSTSARTVRRRLDDTGMYGNVTRKKPPLTEQNDTGILPKLEKDWTISDFYKVIWSNDESKFHLFGSDGRVYERRRVGDDFLPEYGDQTVKFGGGNVIMYNM